MDNIEVFQKKIFAWYSEHKRPLPWRETVDPYKILVSEIMLQQTQVSRVIEYYYKWLNKFPSIFELAKADTKSLLSYWSGLGYNNRALRLRELAKVVVEQYDGRISDSEEKLLELPGIGPYTANAVLAFAFNKDVVVIDTNIRRIFIHEYGLPENISEKELFELVKKAIPKGRCREWYNALMDYGAVYLTSRKTGIKPTSQQSKFAGSNREVRGYVVKELTKKESLLVKDVELKFPAKDIEKILHSMQKQNIIHVNQQKITLR